MFLNTKQIDSKYIGFILVDFRITREINTTINISLLSQFRMAFFFFATVSVYIN